MPQGPSVSFSFLGFSVLNTGLYLLWSFGAAKRNLVFIERSSQITRHASNAGIFLPVHPGIPCEYKIFLVLWLMCLDVGVRFPDILSCKSEHHYSTHAAVISGSPKR